RPVFHSKGGGVKCTVGLYR
ncbi:hypothetical protein A2U01_0068518, partial [Trifolium medium]|nr:hypothetical protein [Trifolium medium]